MHKRTSIRNAIVAILNAHPALSDFFVSRGRPVHEKNAPYGAVVITSETTARKSDYHAEDRVVDLRIKLVVKASSGADAELDELAEKVEELMDADPLLGGLVEQKNYQGCSFDFEDGAQADLASIELRYTVNYSYMPVLVADDFETAAVEIDMSSPRNDPPTPHEADGQIDARATIVLEQ